MPEKSAITVIRDVLKKILFSIFQMAFILLLACICNFLSIKYPLDILLVLLISIAITFALCFTYATRNKRASTKDSIIRCICNLLFSFFLICLMVMIQRQFIKLIPAALSILLSFLVAALVDGLVYAFGKCVLQKMIRVHGKRISKMLRHVTAHVNISSSAVRDNNNENPEKHKKTFWEQLFNVFIIPTMVIVIGVFVGQRVQNGNRIINPFIEGQQISAISKEKKYGKDSSDELLNVFLAQEEYYEASKIAVQQQEREHETLFRITTSERYSNAQEMTPIGEKFITKIGDTYYLGGYFRLFLTNPYDYDLIMTEFSVTASNITVDKSPFLDAYPFVTRDTVAIIITNSGWGSAKDVEMTFKDARNTLSSVWSNDNLGLVIPEIAPGERISVVLLSADSIPERLHSQLKTNPATIIVDFDVKDNSGILHQIEIDISTDDNGFISHGIGSTSTAGPKTYGIIINTSENDFELRYPSRDLINANGIGEFLFYLASDKSCTMSLRFKYRLSDGNSLESITYDNIKIRVPYYEGEGRIGDGSAVKDKSIDKSEIKLFYPFVKETTTQ